MSVQTMRNSMSSAEATGLQKLGPCPPHLHETWVEIPLSKNKSNRTKLVWPEHPTQKSLPLLIYFHGGGYAVGSPDLVLLPARAFAEHFGCVVACPALNQLPEMPFLEATRGALGVVGWLAEGKNLNGVLSQDGDGSRVDHGLGFVVGGLSAGAATAAVIGGISSLISQTGSGDDTGIKDLAGLTPLKNRITGLFTGIPALVHESMLSDEYAPLLKSRDEVFDENKAANDAMRAEMESWLDLQSVWYSPLNLDRLLPDIKGALKNHPPKVFIYGCERDPFRDDSVIYAKWLENVGHVDVRASVLEGQGHEAWISAPWESCHTEKVKKTTMDGMGWLLGREWDEDSKLPFSL